MTEKYVRYEHHVELIRDLTHMLSSFVNLVMRIKQMSLPIIVFVYVVGLNNSMTVGHFWRDGGYAAVEDLLTPFHGNSL